MAQHNPKFTELVKAALANIKEVDIDTVKKMLDDQVNFVLLDVREKQEWTAGHLPKATHLSKGIVERDIEKLFPDEQTQLVLYCGGGFRSALAADNLRKMGYRQVNSMVGGIRAWRQAGYEIVQD